MRDGSDVVANRFDSLHRSATVVYIVFAFTGVVLVLPGAMMPLLLQHFHLRDAQGGALLFAFFVGSAGGALLARGRLPHSIARGLLVAAVGTATAAYVASLPLLLFAMLLVGLGLGITMTSSSLLQSRNHSSNRSAELTRLNLIWSLGATAGPWLALHGTHSFGVRRHLLAVSIFSCVLAVAALSAKELGSTTTDATQKLVWPRRTVFLLLLIIPLAPGIEAAVGGWLTTFADRSSHSLQFTVAAGTCFWAGMLLSRFVQSFRRISAQSASLLLWLGPGLMLSGFAMAVYGKGVLIAVGSALIGVGAGPMYPLLLAYSLQTGEQKNIAFAIAGCGSSLLPMLTGALSSTSGDIRIGLMVPILAAVIMLLGDLVIRRDVLLMRPGMPEHDADPLS